MDYADGILIPRNFLETIFLKFSVPADKQNELLAAISTIENNQKLFDATVALVEKMVGARNTFDQTNYQCVTPEDMDTYKEFYSFILLLACVVPSIKNNEKRGIPYHLYEDIPYRPMKAQFQKFVEKNDVTVSDFPWDMNFYTCSIFLFDRFYFILHTFYDEITVFRSIETGEALALYHGGVDFRRDGQINGINSVYDKKKFMSIWQETDESIMANRINPMGFVERQPIKIMKSEYKTALQKGDKMLAFHIPGGPGYTPEKLKSSMRMAMEFYEKYFSEYNISGFWSESWLYDTRLSLVLDDEKSNIVKVAKQFYNYPINEGDSMLRLEAFGGRHIEPTETEAKTSLQAAVVKYMKAGKRFNTLSAIVLKEEVEKIGQSPYISPADIDAFNQTVDSHLL